MPAYDFSFEADPRFADAALRCLLRRRMGRIGPLVLILLGVLLPMMLIVPDMRPMAYILGGATLMLLLLFLLAVQARRRLTRRFYRAAPHRTIRVVIDDDGVGITTALGATKLAWRNYERVWRCDDVTLLFYGGWNYFAIPTGALPPEAMAFAESRIGSSRG